MFDGKIDGKFIIGNGDSISQGIVDELGLTKDECKKISHSIWAQIFKEFDDPQNVNVSNNQNINPNSGNNYLVHKNAVIRLSKECWQKIVNLINTVLKKNIEIDNNDILCDGKKIIGATTGAVGSQSLYMAHISFYDFTALAEILCDKDSSKTPGCVPAELSRATLLEEIESYFK